LKRHPETLDQLTEHRVAANRLVQVPLRMLPVDGALLSAASAISSSHRLLTNDDDFDRFPGITVWKPR
jgi:predicted nucleic acid-binding protein